MEKKPLYKIVYYYIPTLPRTYPISFISLFVLITSFFFWEELTDVFDFIIIFILFFAADFFIPYTGIKTPWVIRFFGAVSAEFVVISGSYIEFKNFLPILWLIPTILFIIESWKIMPNKIDWSGNSKIAQSYRKNLINDLKEDATIFSKYYSFLWGRKIISYPSFVQISLLTKIEALGIILYSLAGFLVAYITGFRGQFFLFIDNKFSRFVILFIIVLVDIWNFYKEKHRKKMDIEKSLEDEPYLSFVASVFQSKVPYFYLFMVVINFMIIFAVIAVTIVLGTDTINSFLKSAYFNNAVIIASTEFKVNSPIRAYLLYILTFVFFSSYLLLPFLVYLGAYFHILKNFARRHNNLKPLNYQRYQEILIFISINYLFFSLFFYKRYFSFIFSVALFLIPLILSCLLILNYKFGKKTPLTNRREHILWLTLIPGLIFMIDEFKIGKYIIFIFYIILIFSLVSRFAFLIGNSNQSYFQLKKILVILLIWPLLDVYLFESSVKYAILTALIIFISMIVFLFITKEFIRLNTLPPNKQKASKWFNIFLGIGGPYTQEELRELGYKLPQDKIQ